MVAPGFDPKAPQNPQNSPGDNRVGSVDESDSGPSPEQLAQAAADLNSAEDGSVPAPAPEPAEPVYREPAVPPSVQKRMDIAEKNRARRLADMVPGKGHGPMDDGSEPPALNMTGQDIYYGQYGDAETNFMGEPLNAAQLAPAAPQPTPSQEPGADLVTIKVDGEERQVSRDELVRSYQKDQAADLRLQQANDLLSKAQGVAAAQLPTATTPAEQSGTGVSPTEPISEPGLNEIDYTGIAEKLQLGEVEDGAAALKGMVEQAVKQRQDVAPIDPAAQAEQVANMVHDRTQSDEAKANFESTYTDIVADPRLYEIAGRNAVEMMIEDFAANGAREEQLNFARQNPQQALDAHRAARLSGQFTGLRSPDEIYTAAGDKTREWLQSIGGQPRPTPASENVLPLNTPARADRARTAQQSPTLRQAPAPAPQQTTPVMKSASEKIAEIKRGRGQFPAGSRVAKR